MIFDIPHLRCFVALAEELHFGRAAKRLNMTQAPLSRQIQQLEHVVGVLLVERNSRSVRLTAAGKTFLADARSILRDCEEAALTARRVAKGEGGLVTLGFIPATSYSLLPRLVAFMAAELPQVQIALKEMVTANQVEALENNAIDAAILRMPIELKNMEMLPISRDRFVMAVPKGRPLAGGRTLTPKDLDRIPLIMYAPVESRYHYDLLSSIFQTANIRPNFVQFAREIHTMLALVSAGLGAALVPSTAVNLAFAGVQMQPIDLPKDVFSELTLVWRKDNANPALQLFVRRMVPKFLSQP